jgi:hypothetical protein
MKRSIIKSEHQEFQLNLEKVIPNDQQILWLFKSLESKSHVVSHKDMPEYSGHVEFVQNNPYRVWYIVNLDNKSVADLYIQNDNSIGLNNFENLEINVIREVLEMLFTEISPLKPIPSKRFGKFFFRISSSNFILQKKIESLGYFLSEFTYVPVT